MQEKPSYFERLRLKLVIKRTKQLLKRVKDDKYKKKYEKYMDNLRDCITDEKSPIIYLNEEGEEYNKAEVMNMTDQEVINAIIKINKEIEELIWN